MEAKMDLDFVRMLQSFAKIEEDSDFRSKNYTVNGSNIHNNILALNGLLANSAIGSAVYTALRFLSADDGEVPSHFK